jgi:hypothetical protein
MVNTFDFVAGSLILVFFILAMVIVGFFLGFFLKSLKGKPETD